MGKYLLCTVRFDKVQDNGITKKVSEKYLVNGMSFTEAEARIIEYITPFISGEFQVSAIQIDRHSEVFKSDSDKYYSCKLAFITLDEKSGSEKKISTKILVQADDIRDAIKKLDEGMKGTMADYVSLEVKETPIMDIVEQESEQKSEE